METYRSMILGGAERNAEKLGAYVAWLVSNQLIAPRIEKIGGSSVTRVRMHDLTGADFLATVLHGELKADQLSEAGQAFTEHYLVSGLFDEDYEHLEYSGENEWHRFEEISPKITRAYQNFLQAKKPGLLKTTAKILRFPGS